MANLSTAATIANQSTIAYQVSPSQRHFYKILFVFIYEAMSPVNNNNNGQLVNSGSNGQPVNNSLPGESKSMSFL